MRKETEYCGRILIDISITKKPTHTDQQLNKKLAHQVCVQAGLAKCLTTRIEKLTIQLQEKNLQKFEERKKRLNIQQCYKETYEN